MHASRERGAAAIEFALVVPLLVTFIFGIVEGGTRYAQQSEVNHWAFVAARDLSIDPTTSPASVVDDLNGDDETEYVISAAPTNACATAGTTSVTVTVSATKVSPTRLFGDYTITGEGVARCEN